MKAFLVILLLLGFAWGYPPTRARMLLGMQPVLHKLGPVGEMIVTPVERYSAKNEVNFILEQLQLTRTEGREIPDAATFTRWVNKRLMTKNQGRDPWNQPYYMLKVAGSLTVGSIGEDGVRGTDDDIKKTIPF